MATIKSMKFFFYILFGLCLSLNTFAKTLSCEIKINSEKIFSNQVTTSVNKKIVVGKLDVISVYVTEHDNDFYTLEAFIPEQDARLYSESFLRNINDKLSTTYWGRDSLIDLFCEVM